MTATVAAAEALRLYEQAAEKENVGKLGDAISFYRKAFELDSRVDKSYRDKILSESQAPLKDSSHEVESSLAKLQLNEDETLGASRNKDAKPEPCYFLQILDDDTIVILLRYLAATNTTDWISLSLTCKRLAHLGFDSSVIWEDFSRNIYPLIYPQLTQSQLEFEASSVYSGWKKMYSTRPFVKFNGVYISICTYLREGSNIDSLTLTNPVHMITYYRYLRLFKSGKCLRLLTTDEPKDVVPKFTADWAQNGLKDVYNGFWCVENTNKLIIEGEGSIPEYQFTHELQISGKHFNRLKWIQLLSTSLDNNVVSLSLRNEKHFTFAKVKKFADGN